MVLSKEEIRIRRLRKVKNIEQAWLENSRVKCVCGHYIKDHQEGGGRCNECDCEWFWPNENYVQRKQREKDK